MFFKADVSRLKDELSKAQQIVKNQQTKEDSLKEQLSSERKKKTSTLSTADKRPAALVRKYGELYAQTRIETLESLDKLTELEGHDDLKSKLLFSVIVVRTICSITKNG